MPRTARILAGFFLAVVLGLGAAAQPSGLAARPELRAVQDALARWDRKAAAHHLETLRPAVETSADLAAQVTLLEIALAPEPERLRRYLAFAAAFAEREEGLTALIAALALAEARIEKAADAEAVIAEDEEVFVFEDEEPVAEPTRVEHPIPGAPELDALLRAAAPLVDAWRARRPDDVRVRLAQRLLLRNRAGARADREPLLRVPTGTPIPVPSPLAEPLRVLVHRLPHPGADVRPYLEGTASDPPVLERVLPAGEIVADLPALPAGAYVLEARSEKSAWRDLRRIVVSDLQLAAQVFPDGVAVLVALKRRPAGGVALAVTDTAGGFEPARGVTDSSGFVLLPLSLREGKRANGNGSALEIAASIEDASGIHTTSLSANVPAAAGADDLLPELDAHVLTDRPLYRAGETIEGRLVVRVHRPAPMPGLLPAAGVKPVTEPLAGRELRLEVELPKAKPAVLDLVTDAWGVAPFSIRLAPTAAPGEIRLSAWMPLEPGERFAGMDARSDAPKVRVLGVTQPAQIQDYKRPPLLLEVAWPEVKSRNENPVIVVTARHPAGTPAAGLAGTATVSAGARWSERPLRHEEPFVLDAGGRAEIRLGLSRLEVPADCSFWVDAEVTVTAADGQRVRRGPGIMYRHETSPSAPPAAEPSATIDVTGPGGRAKAGEPVTVKVQGPAGAPVLLSVARETLLHCRSVVLDARGRAEVSLPTERDWWPSVFVAATGFDAAESGRWWEPGPTRIDLEEPAAKLTVALEKDRETYLPGARASWKLTTRDGDGRPVPATVSMAVVDETLFALARDRTRDPWDVLRSRDGSLRLNESRSPSFAAIWDALGQLLRGGVIPAPSWSELLGFDWRGGGAYGGRRYGGYGEGRDPIAATRKDFRATAFFAPAIVTGDDGKAEVSFSFPDDLTTWRVTMCAVGKGREAALVRETARTEKPLAVELELPRLFRSGDELAVPASVHQTGGAPQEVALELEAGGALELPAGDRRIELSTAPDAARGREVTLTAVGEGEAILRAVLTSAGPDGEVHDRLERKLSVLTRNAHRIERDSALVSGRAILEPPRLEGIPRHGPLTVEVLGSVEALLDKASAYLAAYPHGCVEQIASGLAPLLLAIETHRALGGEGHGLTPPQAHRLEVGLARLRDLQQPDGGFAWWPGLSDSDPTMSAIVFGFLARMREVGLDPADYGLRTEADLEIFGQAERALTPAPDRTKEDPATGPFPTGARAFLLQPLARDTRREQALALAAAELMTARLLLRPKDEAAARICAQLGAGGDRLPTGLAARLGRALARSGNLEAAGSLLTTLRARLESTGSFGADLSIAESPACRAAALLELVLEIAPKDVLRDRLVRDLMRRSRDGRLDHTAGTAAAVWALARERKAAGAVVPPAEAFTLALMGEAAGQPIRRELRCDPAEGWSWSLELPSELERVAVDGPTGRRLLVTARVAYAGDGATAGALDRPIRLDRRLYRLAAKADGSFQRERLDAEVARGDLLEVELAIEAPPDLDHLVLECPVPAGFEAIAQQGLVVHDDRVALTVPRLFEGGRESRTFRMIPGRAGRVVWPPAEIEAMYAPEKSGRSSGAALTVGAPRAIAADA
ncbi:MAG: hypothetical protein JXQ29_03685, partial [Planctomycetes bacterium]|nr:hypothetical protein [Planctomycetota bacterium]